MASVKISRRKLADYFADRLLAGDKKATLQMAAYLIESRREREADLIILETAENLANRGFVAARVESARALDESDKIRITEYIKAQYKGATVWLEQHVDENLLGGFVISTPNSRRDASVRHRINVLRGAKVA